MEEKNKNDKLGFVERKTVDMKIYSADVDVAKWFKQFCDKQGIKFNVGMAMLKRMAEETEFKIAMSTMFNELHSRIELIEKHLSSQTEENTPNRPEVLPLKKTPRTFGSKRNKDGN